MRSILVKPRMLFSHLAATFLAPFVLESQQHSCLNTSLWHIHLVPEGRVTHDVFALLHVPRSPRWPREPGLCFADPAPQTRVTGLSQPQLLGAVSFSLLGTSRRHGANATPSRRKRPQSSHTNWWQQPVPDDRGVAKSTQSCNGTCLFDTLLPT